MPHNSSRYTSFLQEINKLIPRKRVFTDELRTLAWGTDASFYRLIPKVVIIASDEKEVSDIVRIAHRNEVPVTFRAAGTSLSGQSITDSVLIVAGKGWEKYSVSDDRSTVTVQPGIIGARLNEILAPYGRMFAPDPASKKSAMVGGIIINNASGMNCGTHANSDRILLSARIILADGTILDTADEESRRKFRKTHSALIEEIEAIRDAIRADEELSRRIHHKYSIKNVTGLNLLPFVTYDDPFEIIAHAIVGSEGTLAFLAEATVMTSHLYPCCASAMTYFDSMAEACRCVVELKKNAPVHSCEMLDSKSLEAVHDPTGHGLTALLLDTKADSAEQLNKQIAEIEAVIARFKTVQPPHFSTDPAVTSVWWGLRSGIFPAVGGTRTPGTTALIEDIAFHIDDLPKATVELAQLLQDCGYKDACIYGHALEGNYHFIIAQSFDTPEEVERYRHLMEEIEHLVVDRYDGSLKAEHGVGRNMAPFVRKEWGDKAYTYMRRIKEAFDPGYILNRGVVFNDDDECYVKNMKPLPLAHGIVDKCIECGFCEVNCVSCGLTLSARQRTVVVREIARLRKTGLPEDLRRAERLEKSFRYLGEATCAGDGLCSTSCPMKINTGELVHVIREHFLPEGSAGYRIGESAARHLGGISGALRLGLGAADLAHRILGDKAVNSLGRGMHKLGLPLWTSALPLPYSPDKAIARATAKNTSDRPKVVYFPSCINRTMGITREKGKEIAPLVDTMINLCEKAGYDVIFPENIDGLCCGMIWESKGMPDIADEKTAQLELALLKASENGRYPVMCDQSPCLHRMRDHIKSMKLYEPAEFISTFLAPNLEFTPVNDTVAVHVTCSSRLMGLSSVIIDLARRCSTNVVVPAEVGCCGFAGDKGFNVPELNRWALRKLRPALTAAGVTAGYSNSRTCEIGLTYNSGVSYKSIAYLVDACTKPRK